MNPKWRKPNRSFFKAIIIKLLKIKHTHKNTGSSHKKKNTLLTRANHSNDCRCLSKTMRVRRK